MKKSIVASLFLAAALAGGWWLAFQRADAQTAPEEPSVTLTKSKFEKLLAQKVADALEKEKQSKAALDKTILQADSWHTAIFQGVEYVIYTGPGTVVRQIKMQGGAAKPSNLAPAPSDSTPRLTPKRSLLD